MLLSLLRVGSKLILSASFYKIWIFAAEKTKSGKILNSEQKKRRLLIYIYTHIDTDYAVIIKEDGSARKSDDTERINRRRNSLALVQNKYKLRRNIYILPCLNAEDQCAGDKPRSAHVCRERSI